MKPKITKTGYYGYALTLPKTDKRRNAYKKQRRKYGFDDTELWSLYTTVARFILPRLKRYKEIDCGCPIYFEDKKEWIIVIQKMITAFEIIARDDTSEFFDNNKEVKEGLALFSEHFLGLWW